MKKGLILIAVVALAGSLLAACGDDDDDGGDTTAAETTTTETAAGGGGGAGGAVEITAAADGSLAYDQSEVSASAGPVTINFDNPASLSHDVKIEDSSGAELGGTDLVAQGDTSATVELQPGSYTFFCSVSGHRQAGMEGTLTVN